MKWGSLAFIVVLLLLCSPMGSIEHAIAIRGSGVQHPGIALMSDLIGHYTIEVKLHPEGECHVGDTVQIDVKVMEYGLLPAAGVLVSVIATNKDTDSHTEIGPSSTGNDGVASLFWRPSEPGTYELKVVLGPPDAADSPFTEYVTIEYRVLPGSGGAPYMPPALMVPVLVMMGLIGLTVLRALLKFRVVRIYIVISTVISIIIILVLFFLVLW